MISFYVDNQSRERGKGWVGGGHLWVENRKKKELYAAAGKNILTKITNPETIVTKDAKHTIK